MENLLLLGEIKELRFQPGHLKVLARIQIELQTILEQDRLVQELGSEWAKEKMLGGSMK